MILNYDKVSDGFTSIFDKIATKGRQTVVVTKEIKDAFTKLEGVKFGETTIEQAYKIAEAYGVANKEVVEFVHSGKGGLKEYEASMQAASQSTTLFTKGLSTLKTIGGTLLSTFANMAVMYATSWMIQGVFTIVDNIIHAEQKAIEKMNNSVADYTDVQSEVENINSQLDDTASKIDDLNAKKNLSFTDKKELENLQAITRELGNQKRIAEENELIQGKKAAKDTIKAFNKQYKDGKGIIDQNQIDEYLRNASTTGTSILTTDSGNLNAVMDSLELYKKMKKEALEMGDDDEVLRVQKLIDDTDSQIWEEIATLQSYKDTLSNLPEEALGDTGKELLAIIEDTINYVMKNLDSYTNTQNMIDNIFAKASFDGVKDSLISAGKEGTDALNSLISSTPGLTNALDQAGVSAQELFEYIMALADPEALNLDNIREILENDFVPDIDGASEHIKAARQQIWNEFSKDKSDEEIEIFYRYVHDNDLDISDWNVDDLSVNFDRASESAKEATESVKSFYDIMSNTEEGNFNEALDNYQSSLDTLSTSLNSFKAGELSDTGALDLIQQFPELAYETDNLEAELTKLMNVQMSNSMALIDDQIKQLKETGEDASGLRRLGRI